MAHSKLNQHRMFDWIEQSLDQGINLPTDDEIVARFVLNGTEQARTLLADLADAGRITIKGYGDTRTITIGRKRSVLAPAPRPIPSIVGKDAEVERAAKKIAAIAGRASSPTTPAPPPPPPQQPTPVPVAAAVPVEIRAAPAPPPAQLAIVRLPTAPGRVKRDPAVTAGPPAPSGKRTLTVALPADTFRLLADRAKAAGLMPGALSRDVLVEALSAPTAPLALPKPIITAAMAAAALRDAMPICNFTAMLLARGFASYERDASLERCA